MTLFIIAEATGIRSAIPASAATITVDDLSDTSGGATCTLRNAIDSANTNTAVGGCAVGTAGLDMITFALTGTITLSSPLPDIFEELAVKGPGAERLTIRGPDGMNVMQVISVVDLDGLTVTPWGGGGVVNVGTLTVTNSTFGAPLHGIGGGISNGGMLTVSNSTFAGNGDSLFSGISNAGTLTVMSSTFSGITNFNGGAINNSGTLTVTSSTFSENVAIPCPLCSASSGGAIASIGTLTVTNSTFSGNGATNGGGIANAGTLTVTNSTFSENSGGGIYNAGTLTVMNSIVANNPGGNCSGVTGGPDNLQFGDATCAGFSTGDPMLGPLQVNAPGSTATFAILAGSAALDAGDDAFCPATDQRGVARPRGAHCDIGAYEGLSPACGNGVVEYDEQCDDGNHVNGDGCEADCTFTCTNVGGARNFLIGSKPKIQLSKINTESTVGNDVAVIKAEFISATAFSSLAPQTNGARVILRNQAGDNEVDVTLAAGAYGGPGTRGWRRSPRGTRWTFLDSTGAPNNGMFKMVVSDLGIRTPGQIRVIVNGHNGMYPIVSGDEPINATVVLGGRASAAAGECGESAFVSSDCTFNASRDKLVCKK